MSWQEKQPAPVITRLLNEYAGYDGVLEFIFFDDAPNLAEPELHRQAAIATLQVFGERNEQYFADAGTIQAFKNAGLDHDSHFRVVTQPEIAEGREVSVTEFVGPLYDHTRRQLILRGRTSDHLNDYFFVGDEERPDTIQKVPHYANEGYAYAFTEPPYSMRGTRAEINAVFLALNTLLFSNFRDDLVIYQWSTEWSTYFDAGHEWWGAFLWTIHNPRANMVIGIGASTTD